MKRLTTKLVTIFLCNGAEGSPTSVCPGDGNSLSWTLGASGVKLAWHFPRSGWEDRPHSEMGSVYMLEATKQVAGLFLLWALLPLQ